MSHELKRKDFIEILKINENLSHIKDVDSLLDRVLTEARFITKSDAGSIYLKKGDKLTFEYVQNDTLMKNDSSGNRYLYSKQEIPIDNHSIAGYVAMNKTHLLIEDVYKLDPHVPYTFNRSFDESSSYHTQSVLTAPLITSRGNVIGVMQIINAKDKNRRVHPFSKEDELLVTLFANQAAVAIERARMTREIILRMVKLAELRDPEETSHHVHRVAAYSIEIYDRWANKKGYPSIEIKRIKDLLRIAAMLHDVGKVAISDSILKKNGKLNDKEREVMKLHTLHGARLFKDSNSDWDDMAAEIALNHHEKWDGTGYPGDDGKKKKGEEIPLTARIVALADVYDALMSSRSYKESWPEREVVGLIADEKGKHFDPEVVDAFLDIYDVIKAIQGKYSYGENTPN